MIWFTGWTQSCLPGVIVFSNQNQVDSFPILYPGCVTVEGSIGITGTVQNLDGLSQITRVNGTILFNNASSLTNVSGFNNITHIGGSLLMTGVTSLVAGPGFSNLKKINGELRFENCKFNNTSSLAMLDTIGGEFKIDNSSYQTNISLDGFTALKYIGGNTRLLKFTTGVNIFPNLERINGSFYVNESRVNKLSLSNIKAINGEIVITYNHLLTEVNGFQLLDSTVNKIYFTANNSLTKIKGFSKVRTVTNNIEILGEPQLKTISGFDSLKIVNLVNIQSNFLLDSIIGFNNLTNGCNNYKCISNFNLKYVSAFQNVTHISDLIISGGLIPSIGGFSNLMHASNINISLIQMTQQLFFTKLKTAFSIYFIGCANMPQLNGLDSLTNLNHIIIQSNSILTNINAFSNLIQINALTINGNPFLYNLNGFDHPIDIVSQLVVTNNTLLNDCAVQSICDHLSQSSYLATINNNFTNCNGVNQILMSCPNPPDTDGDGIPDYNDNCDLVANPGQEDSNNNGIGDACEPFVDSDGDGVANSIDNCINDYNPNQSDANSNGIGDACDINSDSDADNIFDYLDNCVIVPNTNQADANSNGIGDLCDSNSDSDLDGFNDNIDNCPATPNPDQTDANNNGIGDVCEPPLDSDGDGVADVNDNCISKYNPNQTDLNNNGIGDACEVFPKVGINMNNPKSELQISNGDLYLDNPEKGIILRDYNGFCYRIKVLKISGIPKIAISQITCPQQ